MMEKMALLLCVLSLALFCHGEDPDANTTAALSPFNTRGISYPAFRYIPWASLNESQREDAQILEYSQYTWDVPGTASIEYLSYERIKRNNVSYTGTKSQSQAIVDLGFDNETVYDCYMNHYTYYSWNDMEDIVQQALEDLGWTKASWQEEDGAWHPDSEYKKWEELSVQEQQAAKELCYLPETWAYIFLRETGDLLSLETWSVDYGALAAKEEEVLSFLPAKPMNRFYTWSSLPPGMLDMLAGVGYTSENWARMLQAPMDLRRYRDLNVEQTLAVLTLGFGPEESYDCWIHHYETYSWEELESVGVQTHWEAMGWNQSSWEQGQSQPQSWSTRFDDLDEIEQTAALQLCFTPEMWDGGDFLSLPAPGVSITLAPISSGVTPTKSAPVQVSEKTTYSWDQYTPQASSAMKYRSKGWAVLLLSLLSAVVVEF